MNSVTVYIGVPGSGKSTAARAAADLDPTVHISSRDRLRSEMYGPRYHLTPPLPACEAAITVRQAHTIEQALSEGRNVIIDDTNLDPAVRQRWILLAAKHRVPCRLRYFDVSLDVAQARNAARDRTVNRDVIHQLYATATDPAGRLTRHTTTAAPGVHTLGRGRATSTPTQPA